MTKTLYLRRAAMAALLLGMTGLAADGWAAASGPVAVSGRYPHLAVFNRQSECGIGAVVPWADRLWLITYAPHRPHGSDDKLYEIDADLTRTTRPESVGGTPANRMIHRESEQLLIGPYLIDRQRQVRVIPPTTMPGRLTATARHLTDPAGKVYHYTMEEGLYEVDVRTLDVRTIYPDGNTIKEGLHNPILPGYHGKGAYTADGRLVVANNGEPLDARQWLTPGPSGCLASWDGRDWTVLERVQFCEVTGPGGIEGNPPGEDRLWATGWDHRSVILKLLDGGAWHTFRLPVGDYSYYGRHGWHTEWPRIREVVPPRGDQPAQLLMNMHGTWFDFPLGFAADRTAGLRPLATYLKITGDFCHWQDRIVFGCDDASTFANPLVNQSQSNLWFTTWDKLRDAGPRAGYGGVWVHDAVEAGRPSDPLLIAGYAHRVIHLLHQSEHPLTFTLEIDAAGDGRWSPAATVTVPAGGYAYHILPRDLHAEWLRVTADRNGRDVTAYLHLSGDQSDWTRHDALWSALADIDSDAPRSAGLVRPRGGDLGTLQFAAVRVDGKGNVSDFTQYIGDADLNLTRQMESDEDRRALDWFLERGRVPQPDFTVDAASVLLKAHDGRTYRLPKSHAGYDDAWPEGWPRGIREVVTERSLLNAHGTFYVLPRDISGGVPALKPVCTHGKRITDFCSWRGLLVLAGCRADAQPGEHVVTSKDGEAVLWVGDVDDLWQFGKPRGTGGPWHETAVRRGQPSDPYLMTGYDRKRLALSHDAAHPVTVTIEVDPLRDGTWATYARLTIPPGERHTHEFSAGYAAHWVRLTTDTDCRATATFQYD